MEVPCVLGGVCDCNWAESWRSLDNSKGVGGIIPSTTAIGLSKKIPKLVKDNLLFGNENGNP